MFSEIKTLVEQEAHGHQEIELWDTECPLPVAPIFMLFLIPGSDQPKPDSVQDLVLIRS